jgi:hypothetical protein
MDYVVNRVDHYRVRHHGTSAHGPQGPKAWVCLYGSGHATGVVGTIGFYGPEALEGRQDWLDPLGRPQGHMPIDELPAVLDLLRNERPVFVHWSESWRQTWLDTRDEPARDAEVVGFAPPANGAPRPLAKRSKT